MTLIHTRAWTAWGAPKWLEACGQPSRTGRPSSCPRSSNQRLRRRRPWRTRRHNACSRSWKNATMGYSNLGITMGYSSLVWKLSSWFFYSVVNGLFFPIVHLLSLVVLSFPRLRIMLLGLTIITHAPKRTYVPGPHIIKDTDDETATPPARPPQPPPIFDFNTLICN